MAVEPLGRHAVGDPGHHPGQAGVPQVQEVKVVEEVQEVEEVQKVEVEEHLAPEQVLGMLTCTEWFIRDSLGLVLSVNTTWGAGAGRGRRGRCRGGRSTNPLVPPPPLLHDGDGEGAEPRVPRHQGALAHHLVQVVQVQVQVQVQGSPGRGR